MGKKWKQWKTLFTWAPKSLQTVATAMKLKDAPWKTTMTNLENILKSRDITLPTKVHLVKAMVFLIVMYGYESWTIKKEGWEPKNWCFWIMVLEKTLGSPLDSKKIKPAHSKGNQPWIFIGRTDDVAETPILWPPDTKSQLIGKDPDAGKDWGQEEKAVSLTQWTWVE